jgi:low temperature requirement protein LtrA
VYASLTITAAFIERFGLMIIIVLGETVMGVTVGLGQVAVDGRSLAVALVGITVAFGAWWTYFDFAGHRPPTRARTSTLVWMLTHLPLTAALAVMGAAMGVLAEHAQDSRTPTATAWGLGLSAAVVLAGTALLTTSLEAWRERPRLYRPLFFIGIAAGLACVGLGITRPAPLVFVLALVGLFSIPWLFAVVHIANEDTVSAP